MKRFRKDGYTEEHIDYLREIGHQTGRTNAKITEMFNKKFNKNKTKGSIIGAKSRNGIKSYTRKYTKEQLSYLKKISIGKTHREIRELFNEHFNDDRTENSIKSVMFENAILLTDDGRFKKGNKPKNTLCIGSETLREDGYVHVKVEEPDIWKLKHRLIWEKENGPIPKDHLILFGDKNRLNFDVDNLILVSKAQELKLNQLDLIQNDADLTRVGLAIADMHLKIGEAKRRFNNKSV